jgi:hypothetical protein
MIELIQNETANFSSLKETKEYLREQDSEKSHMTVTFENWKLTDEGLRIISDKGKKVYPIRESGMKTLLRTFGMPLKFYFDKSPTDMLIRDVNRMNQEYTRDSEVMVFLQNKEVRAVAKPTTQVLERHTKLLEAIEVSSDTFERASYSDYGLRMVAKSTNTKPIEVKKGDIINSGYELMYSDTGLFPTSGVPHLLRLICENGCVIREKHSLLSNFTQAFSPRMKEEDFLGHVASGVKSINADTKMLSETFKAMRSNQIKDLQNGEICVRKVRSAIGPGKFDEHEKLSVKIMVDEDETSAINTDLGLYDFMDITTRMAKEYEYLSRRRIESLVGSLVMESTKLAGYN